MNASTVTRMPDETLNHWARVYTARNVREYGYTFEQFLRAPERTLARLDRLAAAVATGLKLHPALHVRELREENRWAMRGALMVRKLWHGSPKRGRRDADGARRL